MELFGTNLVGNISTKKSTICNAQFALFCANKVLLGKMFLSKFWKLTKEKNLYIKLYQLKKHNFL